MSPSQSKLTSLLNEESSIKEKMTVLSGKDELSDEERSAMGDAEQRYTSMQVEIRTARTLVETEDRDSTIERGTPTGDAEQRERIELRSRASVRGYLSAALKGRAPSGAEAELAQAAGVPDGIPFELWQRPEQRQEDRAITPAPGTVGVNLDTLRPYVFAPSVVDRLMVEMPMVASGTYASGTITTAATADAVPKGGAGTTGDVPETAAAFTIATTVPHRIGSSLNLAIEDIASVGQENFESLLRQHISLAMSDELDDQMLNGDGSNDDLTGIFERLTDPTAPAATVESWTRFLAIQSAGIDGLWGSELSHIALLVGPETYRLAAATFQGTDSEDSAASYLKRTGAGFETNSRMPAKATHVQAGILCRKGRSMMPSPTRTAVCPHWGYFSIDDIYTGAHKGQRRFVINTLVGDVILVQPDAYAQVAFRVSA